MKCARKWNLATEVAYRANGYTNHYIDKESFENRIGGSEYILNQLKPTHLLKLSEPPLCCDFNQRGNLISIGERNSVVNIFEWAQMKMICHFYIFDEDLDNQDIQFINSEGNQLEILISNQAGSIWHTTISPTGNASSACIFRKPRCKVRAVAVPGKSNEIVVVDDKGYISLVDLRANQQQKTQDKHKKSTAFKTLAHHPFAPEICACIDEEFLANIYDTRNLRKSLHKLSPNYENFPAFKGHWYEENTKCSYNFDGSEILVESFGRSCLYKNNENKFMLKQQMAFFGPKSEFIAALDLFKMFFYDKDYKRIFETEIKEFSDDAMPNPSKVFKTHPFLPLIGISSTSPDDFLILSTRPGTIPNNYKSICELWDPDLDVWDSDDDSD